MNATIRTLRAALMVGAVTTLAACSQEFATAADFVPEPSADAAPDALGPMGPDGGLSPDAAPTGNDAAPAPDAGPDVQPAPDTRGPDAAAPDAAPDLPTPDAAREAGPDAAPDLIAPPEASTDAPLDTRAPDAAPDTGPATCYVQGPTGPVDCHLNSYGRTYCSATGVCTTCEAAEWLNCDGNDANGCDTFVSETNCGGCGVVCGPNSFCGLNRGAYTCQRKPDAG